MKSYCGVVDKPVTFQTIRCRFDPLSAETLHMFWLINKKINFLVCALN